MALPFGCLLPVSGHFVGEFVFQRAVGQDEHDEGLYAYKTVYRGVNAELLTPSIPPRQIILDSKLLDGLFSTLSYNKFELIQKQGRIYNFLMPQTGTTKFTFFFFFVLAISN